MKPRAGKLRAMAGSLLGSSLLVLVALLMMLPAQRAFAQAASPAPSSQEESVPANARTTAAGQAHETIAGELVKETREAAGEDEEENVKLKHAAPVRWLARMIGISVHGAHLLLIFLNFAIIAVVVIWAARKSLPGVFRGRTASIQQALQEARAASEDANRRLASIEERLCQLDAEIGHMQSAAESEAVAEEARIRQAGDEDIRKVVLAAEQEVAAAAKLARRELTTYTASLAVGLASKQISVDSNTDQVLVRNFTAKLASDDEGGKDGR